MRQEQDQEQSRAEKEKELNEKYRHLMDRMNRLERQLNVYIRKTEGALRDLERQTTRSGQRLEYHNENFRKLQAHIDRMESGILTELQKSREIMFNMVTHDQDIERAKFDLKKELNKREAEMREQQKQRENELKQQQQQFKIDSEKARDEMKRQLYMKLGGIGAPVLVAVTTAAVKLIESIF